MNLSFLGFMPQKAENTFSPLHIAVLVKSKNVFCHCVKIFMGILEMFEPSFYGILKNKIWLLSFQNFSLKFILNTEKYLFLSEHFRSLIVGIFMKSYKHISQIKDVYRRKRVFDKSCLTTPTYHNICICFVFIGYTYLLTLVFIIIYRQFCQKSQLKKKYIYF